MRKGFTLVEIMIVVAIIALLAAIAIPNLLRARVNANESAAMATLKTIVASSTSYSSVSNGVYPASLNDLTSAAPPYIDPAFDDAVANPERQGYTFAYTQVNNYSFWVKADPISAQTGTNFYYIDEQGVICRGAATAAAHAAAGSACPAAFTTVQ